MTQALARSELTPAASGAPVPSTLDLSIEGMTCASCVARVEKALTHVPGVAGAAVKATVVGHGKGDKVTIFKLRRRKHYKKSQGHRQQYTEIQITGIAD